MPCSHETLIRHLGNELQADHFQRFLNAIDGLYAVEKRQRDCRWTGCAYPTREEIRRAREELDAASEALYALNNGGCIRMGYSRLIAS